MKGIWKISVGLLALIILAAAQDKDGYMTSDQISNMPDPPDMADPGGEIDDLIGDNDDEHKREMGDIPLPVERTMDELIGTGDDIRLTSEQELVKRLAEDDKLGELDELTKRTKRLITSGDHSRWPKKIVPYQFQNGLSWANKQRIMQSIKEWQDVTCLRFEPYYDAKKRGVNHGQRMYFQDTEQDCWAVLGFLGSYAASKGQYNQVNLKRGGGCWSKRVILHEIGHGLGLYHQQQRTDRDKNLVVTKANVKPDQWKEYTIPEKGEYEDLERTIPYDYTSIMHYGKYSFVKKDPYGEPAAGFTMRPKQPCYLDVIGNVKKISFYDAKLVNIVYKCNAGCREACNWQQKNKNCYTSKVGNKGCQCICPVDSDDKCKGKGINFKCPEEFPGEVVFKCSNGYCLRPELRCDGIDHCGNGDDERGCYGSCPKGDLNPIPMTVGSKFMRTCKQYYAEYPTYTCLSKYTKKFCCGTCKQATAPCKDMDDCYRKDCRYINSKNDCPVKCKLAKYGERKCDSSGGRGGSASNRWIYGNGGGRGGRGGRGGSNGGSGRSGSSSCRDATTSCIPVKTSVIANQGFAAWKKLCLNSSMCKKSCGAC